MLNFDMNLFLKRQFLFLIIVTVACAIAFTLFTLKKELAKPNLPVLGQIHDFSLTDSNNKNFSVKSLQGKVWVADFIFTTCGSICPIMSGNMASLARSFDLEKDAAFVSITVNPEYDSPEVLRNYAKKYDAYTSKWHFLTGPREKIREILIKNFKLGDMEEPIFHSSYFTLVDRNGMVRGYYDGTQKEAVRKLFKHLSVILKE